MANVTIDIAQQSTLMDIQSTLKSGVKQVSQRPIRSVAGSMSSSSTPVTGSGKGVLYVVGDSNAYADITIDGTHLGNFGGAYNENGFASIEFTESFSFVSSYGGRYVYYTAVFYE